MNGGVDEKRSMKEIMIVSRSDDEVVVDVCGTAFHCLDHVGEEDPAILLGWNYTQLANAIRFANANRPELPAWMNGPHQGYPITVEAFSRALIQHIANAGSGNFVGNMLAAPNTMQQFLKIRHRIRDLMRDNFIIAICGLATRRPLANIYVFYESERNHTAQACPMLELPQGNPGVLAFE